MNDTTFHTAAGQLTLSIPLDIEFNHNPAISGGAATADSRMLSRASQRISLGLRSGPGDHGHNTRLSNNNNLSLRNDYGYADDEEREISSSEIPELSRFGESKKGESDESPTMEDNDEHDTQKGEAI